MKSKHFLPAVALILCSFVAFSENISFDEKISEDSLSVRQIMNGWIKAVGGDSLVAVHTETRKGSLVRGNNGYVPFEMFYFSPGKWYYHQIFAWGDQVVYLFDGNKGWIQDTKCVREMTPEELLYLQLLLNVQLPFIIHDLFPEMTLDRLIQTDNQKSVIINGKSATGLSIPLIFDTESGLLIRAGDIFFEDYRNIGNIKRPYRIILGEDLGDTILQMKMLFTEITHNTIIPDSYFQTPLCALPVKESPIYREWNEVEIDTIAADACVGEYQITPDGIIYVTREKDRLMVKFPGSDLKYEIRPESETDYFIRFGNISFHFIKDDTGTITHMAIGPDLSRKYQKIK